jgi:hypothetical protein
LRAAASGGRPQNQPDKEKMMAKTKQTQIHEAADSFSIAAPDGYWMTVTKGQTFDSSHWLVRLHPHLFKVLQPHFSTAEDVVDA